jgi:hypothetical protein
MSHTPGPWEHDSEYRDDSEDCEVWCGNGIGCVCSVHSGLLPEGSCKANARLIAAAPDLLKACEDSLSYLHGEPLGKTALEFILNNAITKAKGETK